MLYNGQKAIFTYSLGRSQKFLDEPIESVDIKNINYKSIKYEILILIRFKY